MFFYQNIFIIVNLVLPIFAVITVFLRFYARKIQKQPLKTDDWVILFSLAVTIAMSVLVIYSVLAHNYGDLLSNYTPEQVIYSFKFLYIDVILSTIVFGSIKISVILFYGRIFTSVSFIKTSKVFLGICTAWTFAGVLSAIFRSNPISAYWEEMGQTRYNFGAWNITMAVLDIVLDLSILALPLPIIRGLQISTRRKLSVTAVFLLGIFCVVSSAVRLYYAKYLNEVDSSPSFVFEQPVSATYITNSAALWAHIECSASIITANLPILVPVAKRVQVVSQSVKGWLSSSILGGSSARGGSYDTHSSSLQQAGSTDLSDVDSHHRANVNGVIKADTTHCVSAV